MAIQLSIQLFYQVTKVDFIAFEVFDKLLIVDSTLFDKTPELVFFHTRFQVCIF